MAMRRELWQCAGGGGGYGNERDMAVRCELWQ